MQPSSEGRRQASSEGDFEAGMAPVEGPANPADPPPTPWAALMALVADVRDSVQGRIRLFSLELKKAGATLGQIVALGLLAAFMAHAAWFAFVIGLAWTAIDLGAPWWAVMICVVALHLAIAGLAVLRLVKLAKVLGMPGTMRHLVGKSHLPTGAAATAANTATAAASGVTSNH